MGTSTKVKLIYTLDRCSILTNTSACCLTENYYTPLSSKIADRPGRADNAQKRPDPGGRKQKQPMAKQRTKNSPPPRRRRRRPAAPLALPLQPPSSRTQTCPVARASPRAPARRPQTATGSSRKVPSGKQNAATEGKDGGGGGREGWREEGREGGSAPGTCEDG